MTMAAADRNSAALAVDGIGQLVFIGLVPGLLTMAVAAWGRLGG
ncbi:MAG: hypothetical protein QJR07_16940 [Acetobacteraceae bacterium]|nr:hypothetical protein [Acetobacteraceae bacterium]